MVSLMHYAIPEVSGVDDADQVALALLGATLTRGLDLEAVDTQQTHQRALEQLEVGNFIQRDMGLSSKEDSFANFERALTECTVRAADRFARDPLAEAEESYRKKQNSDYRQRQHYHTDKEVV